MHKQFLSRALNFVKLRLPTSTSTKGQHDVPDSDTPVPAPQLILCIPGPWTSRSEFLRSVVEDSDGYIFAGGVLMHIESQFACELELEEVNPKIPQAFKAAGAHWRDTPEMLAINGHRSVVYLVGPGGSREAAELMILAAAGLIKAGGLGVKVESSGVAHAPDTWLEFAKNLHLFSAHDALVVYVTGDETHTCGMHNFGLRDAITHGSDQAANVEALQVFTRYLFREAPVLRENHTFSVGQSTPRFRLKGAPSVEYGAQSLFNNPFGAWRLVPL